MTEWVELDRVGDHKDRHDINQLTVVAALPGWGRTTWLRQLADRVIAEGRRVVWVDSPRAFDAFLDGDEGTDLVIVDDVLLGRDDAAWTRLSHHLDTHAVRAAVSTLDHPPEGVSDDLLVLDERDLALTEDQVNLPSALGATSKDFGRLESCPYGAVDVDEETGQTHFQWSERAWQLLLDQGMVDNRRAVREASAAGHLTLQLFHLCLAGDWSSAEVLVFNHFRYFLLATDEVTARALIEIDRAHLSDHPNLTLLIGQLLVRRGSSRRAEWYFRHTAEAVDPSQGRDLFDTHRLTCRRLLAQVSLGDRIHTEQGLDAVREMLGSATDPGLLRLVDDDPVMAREFAAELYIPFWAAIQTDHHGFAQQLGEPQHRQSSGAP